MQQPFDNVVIVGGGFAGLYTALSLCEQNHHPPILLIEPRDRFLFLPLLYELLSGELRAWEIAPRYDDLLAGRGVGWLQDRVVSIDLDHQQIHTRGGRSCRYGHLVLATGGESNTFGVPGALEHTIGFRSLEDVHRLREVVERMRRDRHPLQRIAIVGAGPSGVELACKMADLVGDCAVIELIEMGGTHLPGARAFNREQALLALQRKDVRLRLHTRVVAVRADGLTLCHSPDGSTDGEVEELGAQAVIWTAGLGFQPPALTPQPDLSPDGRLLCDPNLRLRGREEVFVAGDLAHVPCRTASGSPPQGAAVPATAQVAFQQAPLLAANLMRCIEGRPLADFHWNDLGEMISLGVESASLCASGFTLSGPSAYQVRRLAYLARFPGMPHQLRVAAGWLADWIP